MESIASKKIDNDITRLRLTIQINLSGFSVKISNPLGKFLYSQKRVFPIGMLSLTDIGEFIKEEINSPIFLNKQFAAVRVYYGTEKYCIVPADYYSPDKVYDTLNLLHPIKEDEQVLSLSLPETKAYLIYAIPSATMVDITKIYENAEYYPIVYFLLDRIPFITENNKMIVHFARDYVHIVAAERDKLLLANSYPTANYVTALYYIFMAMKELMFNPGFTKLQVSGLPEKTEESGITERKLLRKYFAGYKEIS
ncbi:MAG: DUF3822 family protein [Bacteroidales bacterium]